MDKENVEHLNLEPTGFYSEEEYPETVAEALTHCPRCENIFFVNSRTGQYLRGQCNTYSCEYCGYRKARKLQNALRDYLKKFKFIRMWTFTFTDKIVQELSTEEKFKFASKAWQNFLIFARRHPKLSKYDRKFQYVKVVELQKNGTPHYHCIFDRYIPRVILNDIWEQVLHKMQVFEGKIGNAYVEGKPFTAGKASNYVTKYLMKTIIELGKKTKFRMWSKSEKVSLFKKREKDYCWYMFVLQSRDLYLSAYRVSLHIRMDEIRANQLTNDQEFKYIVNTS